jgi:hypothetical protein
MAKKVASSDRRSRQTTKRAEPSVPPGGDAIVTQVAEYVGGSLGRLLNQRDRLMQQIASVDQRIAAARSRVASAVAERLPSSLAFPALPRSRRRAATATKSAGTQRKGNRKKHRGKPDTAEVPEQALRKMSAAATGRAATRKRATARSSK